MSNLVKPATIFTQYDAAKAAHPNVLMLIRVGDFYEAYGADAELLAKTLEITLTGRDNSEGVRIAMAGVPFHSVEKYLTRLIQAGIKTALLDQMEDPKQAKGLVKREVKRVLEPTVAALPEVVSTTKVERKLPKLSKFKVDPKHPHKKELMWVAKAADTDLKENRTPLLTRVCHDRTTSTAYYVATNTHALHICNLGQCTPIEGDMSAKTPYGNPIPLGQADAETGEPFYEYQFETVGGFYKYSGWYGETRPATYPNWRRVIPSEFPKVAEFDAVALLEIVAELAKLAKGTFCTQLWITVGDGTATFKVRDLAEGEHERTISYTGDMCSIAVNALYLRDAIEIHKDKVYISTSVKERVLGIHGTDGWGQGCYAVVMPCAWEGRGY